ncbi:nuclear transport factor 2 family protein [Pseudonocardia kujensis]|uniref:nuclear transport factor 2 family protein n=1 Tax=Pseudonocardia kujensis TaxID=1128675 RepID=UPI001E5AADCE|nr:nuclear transport factor 2 family protein [Pseudonocardia kujensis]MCE0763066.1 nuclear transport factor 2 family protein [Pseudonocardia kujensis]
MTNTTTDITTDITTDVVARYLTAWNTTDGRPRAKAVAAVFTEDARYVDPLADVTGHEAITALIGGVHAQFPGFVFGPVGDPDAHHDVVRFRWGLGPDGAGEPPVIGADAVTLAPDGRIALVVGFLDRVPA